MAIAPALALPPGCEWQHGKAPILIVAPHGGRRLHARRLMNGHTPKVNDLYTAELARSLAARLDAACIINSEGDRNDLDLNRVTQLLRKAPWFLRLLDRALSDILARYPSAEVLFVHGWNVTQARCDVGIGTTLAAEADAIEHRAALTVAPEYVTERLATLRSACAPDGVLTTYGERYPARHPNNALQLFRRQPARVDDPTLVRLAAWAAAERIQAVQLELGVPLRWPGPQRDRFLDTCTRVFTTSGVAGGHIDTPPRVGEERAPMAAGPAALQFYDSRSALGLIAGIGSRTEHTVGGRLLLIVGARCVALFTGEDRGRPLVHGGPRFEPGQTGFTVRFDGPLLKLDDGRLYLDLETALAASELTSATVDLAFSPGRVASYGHITGVVRLGSQTFTIDAHGFADPGLALRRLGTGERHTTLSAAFGAGRAMVLRCGDDLAAGVLTRIEPDGATTATVSDLNMHCDGNALTPERFVLNHGTASTLVAEVASQMAIEQPAGTGYCTRITFGAARFTLNGSTEGAGLYEYARRIPTSPGT